MSSLFNQASLVVEPAVYENAKVYATKPFDGTGDLTFSRASSATRVQSDGLIEKVRTNLALQSETLDNASWTKNRSTITANALVNPVNGATTADYIVEDTATGTHEAIQTFVISAGISYTVSVYAKADTRTKIALVLAGAGFASGGNGQAIFNLSTGVVISAINGATARISDAGNGWYRCSITKASIDTAGVIALELVDASDNTSYTGNGTSRAAFFGAQFEVSDFGATPYIATTTAAVSVGPVSGLPRLDYLGSTCPRLLLEPQRSNLQIYSENSALWQQPADGLTVVYNTTETLDPAGFNGAEKVTFSSGNGRMFEAVANALGSVTMSAFVKAGTGSLIRLRTTSSSIFVDFNLTTQTITSTVGTGTITNYGNGWYRVTATGTSATTPEVAQYIFPNSAGQFVYFWGAQFEDGAYATSYIPTLGASVTRVADVALKTGITSLIGQTEGTIFMEVNTTITGNAGNYAGIALNDGTSSNILAIGYYQNGRIQAVAFVGGSLQVNIDLPIFGLTTGNHKFALSYKLNDYVFYVDGVQVGSDISASVPATSVINLYDVVGANMAYSQALLFKTRLTNAQLAELTA